MNAHARNWLDAGRIYLDRRVLSMLFLGFSSGLPFGVLAEPLSAWLADFGLSKTAIGLFALVSLPYSVKFLWSPFIDRLKVPVLCDVFGRRRGWALLSQILLLLAIAAMGFTQPEISLLWTAVFALAVAFFSASQDIVIDAYRIEILTEDQLAAGSALVIWGWRAAAWAGAAFALILSDIISWPLVFMTLAAAVVVGILTILVNPEPRAPASDESENLERRTEDYLVGRRGVPRQLAEPVAWIFVSYAGPLKEFFSRRNVLLILLFCFFYKYGDAVLSVMKVPFFKEIGFTNTDIGAVAKLVGFPPIIVGALVGGLVLARYGMMKGLLVTGVLMALSNLVFVVQAWVGADIVMLAVTVGIENFTTAMGTVAFVAYLSSLCSISYTATQYALLTSVMAFSRTVMSSGAGWVADQVSWPTFFVITTLAALPGLIFLVWMMKIIPPAEPEEASSPAV